MSAMSTAKEAVKSFIGKSGQHETTVHEEVAPAVVHETVKPTHHETVTTAIDREVHQDHYHTSVQPVKDRAVTSEQHKHNLVGTEHRHFEHDNTKAVKDTLAEEASKYKDERTVKDTHHTHSVNPTVAGEHVHHHVHEVVQPVVERETIQPSVTHTTVPIHEVHHQASTHHAASALPAMTMDEYKRSGGVMSGREVRVDGFQGEPKGYSTTGLSRSTHTGADGVGAMDGMNQDMHKAKSNMQHEMKNETKSASTTGTEYNHTSSGTPSGIRTSTSTNDSKMGHASTDSGSYSSAVPRAYAGTTTSDVYDSTNGSSMKKSPSLKDKLNPLKDANGDGKKGIFS